jgi:hypothetical protein
LTAVGGIPNAKKLDGQVKEVLAIVRKEGTTKEVKTQKQQKKKAKPNKKKEKVQMMEIDRPSRFQWAQQPHRTITNRSSRPSHFQQNSIMMPNSPWRSKPSGPTGIQKRRFRFHPNENRDVRMNY